MTTRTVSARCAGGAVGQSPLGFRFAKSFRMPTAPGVHNNVPVGFAYPLFEELPDVYLSSGG